jgi:hypothetical protein
VRIASGEHQHEGGHGERGGALAERLDAVVDQDRERQRAGGARGHEAGEAAGAQSRRRGGRLPGTEADQQRTERPQRGGRGRGQLQAGRGLVEEEGVGEREPPFGSPPGERQARLTDE